MSSNIVSSVLDRVDYALDKCSSEEDYKEALLAIQEDVKKRLEYLEENDKQQ